MLKNVEVLFYKGFKYGNVELLPYNILVGPNASGKSTFLDVITLVKDILNEDPAAAIAKRSSQLSELVWNQETKPFEIALVFKLPSERNIKYKLARYEISISQSAKEGIIIENEHLWLIRHENDRGLSSSHDHQLGLFPQEPEAPSHIIRTGKNPSGWRKVVSKSSKGNDYFKSEITDWNIVYRFGPSKSSLARIPEDETKFPLAIWVKNVLTTGIQFLQLNSLDMRWPCRPDAPVVLESSGNNLPKVVKYLRENHDHLFQRWVEHVKTALPDVQKIDVKEREEDRFLYIYIEYQNKLKVPSWLLSDGTLRLFAQTLIAYLPEKDKIYIIEEPENGLHPQAIETVVQSLSSLYENQILLATHSPVVLRLAQPVDMLCFSKTNSGAIDVVRGDKHPKLRDWQEKVDLATLHAAGVLQ